MILDNIRLILKEYDFTDSIIVDIFSEKYFTKIILLIDYYWDEILKYELFTCFIFLTNYYNLSKNRIKSTLTPISCFDKIKHNKILKNRIEGNFRENSTKYY